MASRKKHNNTQLFLAIAVCVCLFSALCIYKACGALKQEYQDKYSSNHIMIYNPDDCSSSGGLKCDGSLPAETVATLDAAKVKEKAEQNKERYEYAEKETGIPWQILAALHFREAGMNPNKTIFNGEDLTEHVNADGHMISADPLEDAKQAAESYISLAKEFSDVETLKADTSTLEDFGKAFATYKGGEIYQCNNKTYLDTTYVMNGYSEQYMNMKWQDYDVIRYDNPKYSYCTYKEYTPSWVGKSDNIGALAVFVYLGGCDRVSGLGNDALGNGAGGGEAIARAAIELAWPDSSHLGDYTATDAYNKLARELGGGFITRSACTKTKEGVGICYSCANFVSAAIYKSGVDAAFNADNKRADGSVDPHLICESQGCLSYYLKNSSNWKEVTSYSHSGYEGLKPGDILINDLESWNAGGPYTHTFIYLGKGEVAEASNSEYAGYRHAWDNAGNNGYNAMRFVGSSSSAVTSTPTNKPVSDGSDGSATRDFSAVRKAKNADKQYTDFPPATFSDGDKQSMKTLLTNYGDLAYQLGRAVGAPYVAILVQMRYEDPESVCGKNNFWGNGCDPDHAYEGGATIQGKDLGEGFQQYGETLLNGNHDQAIGITDAKEYLVKLGPTWVQGDINGPGYSDIEGMKRSVDALQAFIDSPEGQAIVKTFGNYKGSYNSCADGNGSVGATNVGEAARVPLEERMNWLFPDGAPTTESGMQKYLTTIEVPIINESGSQTTMHLTVHIKLAAEYGAVFEDMLRVNGFKIKSGDTYAYGFRLMASGTGSLSHHSYGTAIDVNSADNPATYTSGNYAPGVNPYSVTDEVVKIWKDHGFYWGGDWSGYYRDYMHFTYMNH